MLFATLKMLQALGFRIKNQITALSSPKKFINQQNIDFKKSDLQKISLHFHNFENRNSNNLIFYTFI